MWEQSRLTRIIRNLRTNAVLHFSGIPLPGMDVPQYSYFHNPLPFLVGHDGLPNHASGLKSVLQRNAMLRYAKFADGAVVPSRNMRGLVLDRVPAMRNKPITVIPHGLADVLFSRNVVGVPRQEGRLVTVSNWAPHKNLEVLLMGLVMMEPNVTLDVIGPWASRRYRKAIDVLIERLELGSRVTITGHRSSEEMHGRVQRSQLFCLLSRSESFGLPALEAQAMATPVIVSADTAMPEVCGAGAVAVSAQPADFARVASALLWDDMARTRLSLAGKENARRYSWENSAGRLVQLVREINPRDSVETRESRSHPETV